MTDDHRALIYQARVAAEYTRMLPELSEVFTALADALEETIARVRATEAALRFYADERMYRVDVLLAHVDRGEIARAALAGNTVTGERTNNA